MLPATMHLRLLSHMGVGQCNKSLAQMADAHHRIPLAHALHCNVTGTPQVVQLRHRYFHLAFLTMMDVSAYDNTHS